MKILKRLMATALAGLLLLALFVPALGAPGGEDDPAVSVSYLEKVWAKTLLEECQTLAEARLGAVFSDSLSQLAETLAAQNFAAYAAAGKRRAQGALVLKRGDVLRPDAGCKLMLYDGAATADPKLVNVSDGRRADAALLARKLYMQSAESAAGVTVTSDAAELWADGVYAVVPAGGTDFGSLAKALSAMGLFRGMTEGYGLTTDTTRAQGLTMFLRLMGLEQQALACTEPIPFTDVPRTHWAYPYVAYAYANGLTNGTAADSFSPDAPITAQHYVTFLLRARRYAEGTDFTYETALAASVQRGVFTQAELDGFPGALKRMGLVYLSYYSLFARDAQTGRTLLEQLLESGVLTQRTVAEAFLTVRSPRRA